MCSELQPGVQLKVVLYHLEESLLLDTGYPANNIRLNLYMKEQISDCVNEKLKTKWLNGWKKNEWMNELFYMNNETTDWMNEWMNDCKTKCFDVIITDWTNYTEIVFTTGMTATVPPTAPIPRHIRLRLLARDILDLKTWKLILRLR